MSFEIENWDNGRKIVFRDVFGCQINVVMSQICIFDCHNLGVNLVPAMCQISYVLGLVNLHRKSQST